MKTRFSTAITAASAVLARFTSAALLTAAIGLSGCQTMGSSQVSVGPSVGPGSNTNKALGDKTRSYVYNSDVYLDVAVPVFDPGIPTDYGELEEENIWPQLRRAESNRFAIAVKKALEKTKAFGSVSVVPTPDATADLYVLGRIDKSNSEDIKLVIDIVDISGRKWDNETFEYRVSMGFFRDRKNKTNDPYEPIFTDIANHVFDLLVARTEASKKELKQITDIRFAQSFSPEAFSQHVATDKKGFVSLTSLPSEQDPMLNRVKPLREQDQMFVDRIQTQYESFSAKTDESYRTWQESTLPNAVAAREAQNKAVTKGILGGAMLLLGASNAKHTLSKTSQVATAVTALAGAYFIKESFGESAEAKAHQARLDEMGENLDIEMDDHVMSLEDETVKLSGTSEEQYTQWKAHLKKMYAAEATPTTQL